MEIYIAIYISGLLLALALAYLSMKSIGGCYIRGDVLWIIIAGFLSWFGVVLLIGIHVCCAAADWLRKPLK